MSELNNEKLYLYISYNGPFYHFSSAPYCYSKTIRNIVLEQHQSIKLDIDITKKVSTEIKNAVKD